jgi:hypothetical protein
MSMSNFFSQLLLQVRNQFIICSIIIEMASLIDNNLEAQWYQIIGQIYSIKFFVESHFVHEYFTSDI